MNSETGVVTELARENQGLVPKLRFPEFRDDGEWVATPLRQLCTSISEKVGNAKLTPVSITAGKGFVSQASKFGRDISGDQYRNYTYLRKGDFAYNKGNSTAFPQGYICQLTEFDEAAASSAFLCFQLHKEHQPRFVQALFDQNVHGRQLASFITSGARSNGLLNIRSDDFYGVKLPLPPGKAEQQKVAECLLALDALIAAETDKLAALRDHKKGLMQHLFPSEGETAPRLRFPEFLDAGDWEERPLGEIAIYQNGKAYEPHIVEAGQYIVVNARYISTDGLVKKWSNDPLLIAAKDDILMVLSDLPNGKALAKCCRVAEDAKYAVNQRIARLTPHSVRSDFLFPVLNRHPYLLAFNDGMNQTHLSKDNVLTCPILLPSDEEEQIAIADCLASLECKITAQSDRLGELKVHKSGLMQQLFPLLNEAAA
jgi:type I restriction enzyme S subunit